MNQTTIVSCYAFQQGTWIKAIISCCAFVLLNNRISGLDFYSQFINLFSLLLTSR